jgi:hypothetical protein
MRYRFGISFTAAALILCVFVAGCSEKRQKAQPATAGIQAYYGGDTLGDLAPDGAIWDQAPESIVPLLPQDLTDPKLITVDPAEVRVRALCSDTNLAFRIVWEDATHDTIDAGDSFSDAVAVQLPPEAGGIVPNPTMGQADKPVYIHLWKASYERQVELGEWNLNQTFPNASVDHYPFQAAPDSEKDNLTEQYTIALAAGNPLERKRQSGVDDLIAHGFGSITHLPVQASKGWSKWADGKWFVVIERPLSLSDWAEGRGLQKGQNTFVAFAVWDGSRNQVGSRKARTAWFPLSVGATK